MAAGDIYCWQEQAGGALQPVKINGSASGQVSLVPLPMSAMPVAKSRIDVHPFSIVIGPSARRSGAFDLTTAQDLTGFFNVAAYQSAAPGDGKGIRPDSREFDQILITADIVGANLLRCCWIATGPVIGHFNFFYQIKN